VLEAFPDLPVNVGHGVAGQTQLQGDLSSRALVDKTQNHPQFPT